MTPVVIRDVWGTGRSVESDTGEGRGMWQRGQCWRVRIKSSGMEASVKVLDADAHSVVLREIHNFDLTARYCLDEIEFLWRLD